MKAIYLALGLVFLSSPALADDFTTTAACGKDRAEGAESAEIGFVETLEETHVYADGKEVAHGGFATQNRTGVQIITIFGEGSGSDVKWDIDPSAKTAQKFSVPIKGAPKKVGAPLPCVLKGF